MPSGLKHHDTALAVRPYLLGKSSINGHRNQNNRVIQQKTGRTVQKLGGEFALITSHNSSNGLRNRCGIRLLK